MNLDSGIAAVGFGLLSAASWGAGDFSGGVASRKVQPLLVVFFSQLAGIAALIGLALVTREALPEGRDILFGIAAGIIGQIGLVALYRAMAIGQMGIAAPVSAVLTAALPVLFGSLTQGFPDALHLIGFALALAGIWFISRPRGAEGRPEGFRLAMLAGLGFSGFLIFTGQFQPKSVFWPLVAARASSLALAAAVLLIRRQFKVPTRRWLPLIGLAGLMDVGGNVFYVLSAQVGRIDIAAVVSSLYPAMTVFLALMLLRERLSRWQSIGVAFALVAIPLIAART